MKDKRYGKRWFDLHNVYRYRNENLERLGFSSYRAYLSSALWKSIRAKVIAATPTCVACRREPATQVHHRAYDLATLRGDIIGSLSAVCAGCHRRAEQPRVTQAAQDRFMSANDAILRPSQTKRMRRRKKKPKAMYQEFAPCWAQPWQGAR